MSFPSKLSWLSTSLAPCLVTGAIIGAVIGIKIQGWFQPLELKLYDHMIQWTSTPGSDSRLLLVTITEQDLDTYGHPLPDRELVTALERLMTYQPSLVGLDLIRNDQNQRLKQYLQNHPNIVTVCFEGLDPVSSTARFSELLPSQVSFSNIALDPDRVVRRHLLFQTPHPASPCQANLSLSLQLAVQYLQANNYDIRLNQIPIQLGSIPIPPIHSTVGGYQVADAGGYQILLNFPTMPSVPTVTLADVLNELDLEAQIQGSIKDRIILIGQVGETTGDQKFQLPGTQQLAPGLVIHALQLSQLLKTVEDGLPLIGSWPGWVDYIWIISWSGVGVAASLYAPSRHRFVQVQGLIVASLGLIYSVFFALSYWIPVVAPTAGFVVASWVLRAFLSPKLLIHPAQSHGSNQNAIETPAIHHEATKPLEPREPISQATMDLAKAAPLMKTLDPLQAEVSLLAHRYQIIKPLAKGGQGRTFLAQDRMLPGYPSCVVKQLIRDRSNIEMTEAAISLFEKEAHSLQLLGQHDQIPSLYAYFQEADHFYLVQEYVVGHSLTQEIKNDRPTDENYVIQLLHDLLEILTYVHTKGVIHRDIKPSNLIRRHRDQRLVLIDFGAIKQIETSGSGTMIGTVGYSPPEQWSGRPTYASDIYAVGVTGIKALTGRSVVELVYLLDPSTAEATWRQCAPQVSNTLATILTKMVELNWRDRYQSSFEALEAVKTLLSSVETL